RTSRFSATRSGSSAVITPRFSDSYGPSLTPPARVEKTTVYGPAPSQRITRSALWRRRARTPARPAGPSPYRGEVRRGSPPPAVTRPRPAPRGRRRSPRGGRRGDARSSRGAAPGRRGRARGGGGGARTG